MNFIFYVLFSLLVTLGVHCSINVPALYIFGDSTVDTGNNLPPSENPYGIDLDSSLPSRWTNGRTISDFIATILELPLVPPFNDSRFSQNSTTGINYAFAGAGILPETKLNELVGNWTFDKQISYFNESLTIHLSRSFRHADQLFYHLSKSLFFISFGINDYFVNYVSSYKNESLEQPRVFAHYLISAFSERLTTLYQMGARKFLINNIWPMGCMPTYHLNDLGICKETINNKLIPYVNSLPTMLHELSSTLPGFDYSYSDNFFFVQELNRTTHETGVTNITSMCWNDQKMDVCPDRDSFLYFDKIHTSELVNSIFAKSCLTGTICFPKGISDLVLN